MTIDDVVNLYVSCLDLDDRDALGWSWWALEGKPDGQVHALDTDNYLQKTFAVKLLMAADAMTEDKLRAHVLPPSRQILHVIDRGDQSIRKIYEEMREAPDAWRDVISEAAIYKIPALLDAFDRTIRAQVQNEEAQVVQAPIDRKKVGEFADSIIKEFHEHSTFNSLAKHHGFFRASLDLPLREGAPPSWGYNQIASKEAFIENWHVHFVAFGEEFGRGMARAEDSRGLAVLMKALPEVKGPDGAKDIWVLLTNAFSQLEKMGVKANAIITSLDLDDMAMLRQLDQFVPKWHKDCPANPVVGYLGAFRAPSDQLVPIYRLWLRDEEARGLCVIDAGAIGEMVQLFPGPADAAPETIRDSFYLRVIDLNVTDSDRQRILSGNPDWLRDHADKERYLRGRVLIQLHQRVDFNFGKAGTAGVKLVVPKGQDER